MGTSAGEDPCTSLVSGITHGVPVGEDPCTFALRGGGPCAAFLAVWLIVSCNLVPYWNVVFQPANNTFSREGNKSNEYWIATNRYR